MNPAELPFDADAMLEGLRTWIECESPTWDATAVNRIGALRCSTAMMDLEVLELYP